MRENSDRSGDVHQTEGGRGKSGVSSSSSPFSPDLNTGSGAVNITNDELQL